MVDRKDPYHETAKAFYQEYIKGGGNFQRSEVRGQKGKQRYKARVGSPQRRREHRGKRCL